MGQRRSRMLTLCLRDHADDVTPSIPTPMVYQADAVTPNIPTPMVCHCACSLPSGAEAASSFFYSTRIAGLIEQQSKLDDKLQFDVQSSTSSWTETVPAANSDWQVRKSEAFEKLKEHPEWGAFFRRQPYELEIGAKIAEGGQVEIFEALGTNKYDVRFPENEKKRLVVKVFSEDFPLDQTQRLLPPEVASTTIGQRYFLQHTTMEGNLCWACGAQVLEDGRFAFIFDRHWGDLCKAIDEFMLRRNGCPPFDGYTNKTSILGIAKGMCSFHELKILHNDLKAANVLVMAYKKSRSLAIADFESSIGVKATRYWRVPEILRALKNCNLHQGETFTHQTTQQTNVYSFAMTCYEVITGCMPFEDHDECNYDIILRDKRPTLPGDPYSVFNNLVMKCWHQDPQQRPLSAEIVKDLESINSWSLPTCKAKEYEGEYFDRLSD